MFLFILAHTFVFVNICFRKYVWIYFPECFLLLQSPDSECMAGLYMLYKNKVTVQRQPPKCYAFYTCFLKFCLSLNSYKIKKNRNTSVLNAEFCFSSFLKTPLSVLYTPSSDMMFFKIGHGLFLILHDLCLHFFQTGKFVFIPQSLINAHSDHPII